MMSNVDASEAYKVGAACIEALDAGMTKRSVVLKREHGRTRTATTDLKNIAAKDRCVPPEYINNLDGPTQEFVDEFIYLIGGPAAIPHYSRVNFTAVEVPESIKANPYVTKRKKK
jgi:hypothetical protein